MVIHLACGDAHDFDFRDVGNGDVPCCMGSAEYGPHRCTCWEPVYDLGQADPEPTAPGLRATPCDDCAYRGNSPERRGDEHVIGDSDALRALVVLNRPFFCHQGIRRLVGFRHPSGTEWKPPAPALEAAYRPPIHHGVPYKADGTPGDLCADWAAARLREDDDA